jgi:hypothetical protein
VARNLYVDVVASTDVSARRAAAALIPKKTLLKFWSRGFGANHIGANHFGGTFNFALVNPLSRRERTRAESKDLRGD